MIERFFLSNFRDILHQSLRDLCNVSDALCKMQCVATLALYIMCTFQHVHFATCVHFTTHALCNTCTLQHVHFATRALCNMCILQHVHFVTHSLCNTLTFQFVHCRSFRVERRPCFMPGLCLEL